MDLDFKIILEQPTSQESDVSTDAQLTVAYMRAMRSGNIRQAQKILEEKEILSKAQEIKAQNEVIEKDITEKQQKLASTCEDLLNQFSNVRKASIETLEDTLALRSDLYKMVKSERSMAAKRFVVANNFLEDAIISGASVSAPLTMIKEALRDLLDDSVEYWKDDLERSKRKAQDPSPPGVPLGRADMGYEYDEDVANQEFDITNILLRSFAPPATRALYKYLETGEETPNETFDWPVENQDEWIRDMIKDIAIEWAEKNGVSLNNMRIEGDPPRIIVTLDPPDQY